MFRLKLQIFSVKLQLSSFDSNFLQGWINSYFQNPSESSVDRAQRGSPLVGYWGILPLNILNIYMLFPSSGALETGFCSYHLATFAPAFITLVKPPGRERGDLLVRASDSRARGRGFDPHLGRPVVSLSKTDSLPKSTGSAQEAVAPSRHD